MLVPPLLDARPEAPSFFMQEILILDWEVRSTSWPDPPLTRREEKPLSRVVLRATKMEVPFSLNQVPPSNSTVASSPSRVDLGVVQQETLTFRQELIRICIMVPVPPLTFVAAIPITVSEEISESRPDMATREEALSVCRVAMVKLVLVVTLPCNLALVCRIGLVILAYLLRISRKLEKVALSLLEPAQHPKVLAAILK